MSKVPYMKLLKEAISEFDTSKTVDKTGPMLEPIIGYKGDGELKTHKDAASILERYYFNENAEEGIKVPEDEKNEIVTGEEPDSIPETKKDIEKEITEALAESDDEDEDDEDGDEDSEDEKEDEKEEVEESYTEGVENSVIEKLIAEMEMAEQEELDVDKEMDDDEDEKEDEKEDEDEDEKEEVEESSSPIGIANNSASSRPEYDEIQESFDIFRDQIEDED